MTQFNMVESPQGPDPKRLLFAVVLTSAVLMAYSYFFTPAPQVAVVAQKDEKPAAIVLENEPPAEVVVHEHATKAEPPKTITFNVHEKVENSQKRTSYRAEVFNQGGFISKFALTDFSEAHVLFNKDKLSSMIKISAKAASAPIMDNATYEVLSSDEYHIHLRHVTKEGLEIERRYQFLDKATIKEDISFKNLSPSPLKVEPVLSLSKADEKTLSGIDVGSKSFLNPGVEAQYVAIKAKDYEKISYSDSKAAAKSFSNVTYVAFNDQFFLSAVVPKYSDLIDHVEVSIREPVENEKVAHVDMILRPFILMGQEKKELSHQIFIGPKQVDLLSSLPVPLDENIDFGWFGVLSRPMLWLLVQIHIFVQNYGLAIIIITFIIKLLTYPLTQKSFSSQQEMKKLAPKMKELQAKFSHDRTLLGQKQMELYKTHGINPLAGCLPLLVQLPIWFAFFQMLRNSVELFDQPFYWWITDLTRPDQYFVLPVLMGASMLVQQAFTPPPTDQPQMKYVMWAMPIFLTFIMLNMPSGLSLYILTNNLLTIVQQIIIKKNSEKVTA